MHSAGVIPDTYVPLGGERVGHEIKTWAGCGRLVKPYLARLFSAFASGLLQLHFVLGRLVRSFSSVELFLIPGCLPYSPFTRRVIHRIRPPGNLHLTDPTLRVPYSGTASNGLTLCTRRDVPCRPLVSLIEGGLEAGDKGRSGVVALPGVSSVSKEGHPVSIGMSYWTTRYMCQFAFVVPC